MPEFSEVQYTGDSEQLRNTSIRVDIHRKPVGWGWGEIFAPTADGDDRLVAVLEHFGAVAAAELPHALLLVAEDVDRDSDDREQHLRFDLELQAAPGFAEPDVDEEAIAGSLTLALQEEEPLLYYDLTVSVSTDLSIEYVRGPWLRVGAERFGADRDDGIFPGLEWVVDDEWSSGTDHVDHPHALRVTPHPNQVAIPSMAIGHDDVGVGLSWDVGQGLPQPVYATPNFVDRQDDTVMGLMYPTASGALEENELRATPPVETTAGTQFAFDATISLSEGQSLDVVTDWVRRNGLPEAEEPRYEWADVVDWIADAYDTNLWIDGEGFGNESGSTDIPEFVNRYVEHGEDDRLVERLDEKREWCEQRHASGDEASARDVPLGRPLAAMLDHRDRAGRIAERLLEHQTHEGAFPYEPDGRHAAGEPTWVERTRPLGQPGETDLGLCTDAAAALLVAWRETDDEAILEGAWRALEFALQYTRPAGDDWWETPIHGPNLLAAGKSAIAYALGAEAFDEERYRERAVNWLRGLLPFTHLWTPPGLEMRYNTKPCFVASYGYAADWTSSHVQWEVLAVFAMMDRVGIDPVGLDPGIDWDRYHEGVTSAALRWMVDSGDPDSLERFRYPDEEVADGAKDAMYADVFDPVDGRYGGALIEPSDIGVNAMIRRDR